MADPVKVRVSKDLVGEMLTVVNDLTSNVEVLRHQLDQMAHIIETDFDNADQSQTQR